MYTSESASDGLPSSPSLAMEPHLSWSNGLQLEPTNWLDYFQRCSRLLAAVIEPGTLTLSYANDYFCHLTGVAIDGTHGDRGGEPSQGMALLSLLSPKDNATIQQLYRRHILRSVLREFYQVASPGFRILDEPVMLTIPSPLYHSPRCVELWLRSDQLRITRRNPDLDEFAALNLPDLPAEELARRLLDPQQLQTWEQQLHLDNYQIEGQLLLEGLDVTVRETIHQITHLLIDRDSILKPEKFRRVDQQMRTLFRSHNTVILSIEGEEVRLFVGSVSQRLDDRTYRLEDLQDSHFFQAIHTNRVLVVPDLAADCRNEAGHHLVSLGVRSLLLIPLLANGEGWIESGSGESEANRLASQVVGVVGVLSPQPYNFDGLDCRYAEQLIPAFTTALTAAHRQAIQQRFITNIHPAVEWRFAQEAERRSWGLPPEPIVFEDVYPLYGISDIRGSSDERNRAIQSDLLEQFQLGLAIVDSACQVKHTALGKQLRLDLLDHIHQLQEKLTVDAEVTALRYLKDCLENYFDYFSDCGPVTAAAVAAYQAACHNDHGCVYRARAAYDQAIAHINLLLRQTWEQWQVKMQQITPHYCDLESTDGIDHMIYAGAAIDPHFTPFHLHSLRYEQLRAVCDCARTVMTAQADHATDLQVTHLVLVQDLTVDIFHDEQTERLFDVRGTRDTRYEIVKKRIDKAVDRQTKNRITQPGKLTLVYSTQEEWAEYQPYLRYLMREGWVGSEIESGMVEPLQGVDGLKFARVRILPEELPETHN